MMIGHATRCTFSCMGIMKASDLMVLLLKTLAKCLSQRFIFYMFDTAVIMFAFTLLLFIILNKIYFDLP